MAGDLGKGCLYATLGKLVSSSLPGSELILPEISVVWDPVQRHQRLGAPSCTPHLLHCTEASPAPAAATCTVAHNGPHSTPGTPESVCECQLSAVYESGLFLWGQWQMNVSRAVALGVWLVAEGPLSTAVDGCALGMTLLEPTRVLRSCTPPSGL